jgi:hypothetical protein
MHLCGLALQSQVKISRLMRVKSPLLRGNMIYFPERLALNRSSQELFFRKGGQILPAGIYINRLNDPEEKYRCH